MPFLVDLKTNLKSLKFGRDAYNNGSTGLPYIQTKMPGNEFVRATFTTPGTSQSIWRTMQNGNLDVPIRGGQASTSIADQLFTKSGQVDQERIKRFLEDPTRGPAFIRTQIGLQLTNPKTETGKGSLFGTPEIPGPIENTRTYNNGINTLAQIKASGTGAHANRHGLVPFNFKPNTYFATVNQQNVVGGEAATAQNRLVMLTQMKMTPNEEENFLSTGIDINRVNQLGISLNRNLLFQYLGGPGSVYGVGGTTIYRTEDTAKLSTQNTLSYVLDWENFNTDQIYSGPEQVPTTKFYDKYGKFFTSFDYYDNRLALLRKMKIVNTSDRYFFASGELGADEFALSRKFGISSDRINLFDYSQGPGTIQKDKNGKISVDKSNTIIKRSNDSNTTKIKSSYTMTYDKLDKQNPNSSVYDSIGNDGLTNVKTRTIQDFRDKDPEIRQNLENDGYLPMGTWTEEKSLDYRFFVKGKRYVDAMNLMYPQITKDNANNNADPWTVNPTEKDASTDDTIKFVFEAISNQDPKKSVNLFFRAFLNGNITDNNSGTWNGFKYMGRGEDFYTYAGFTRTIGFAFRVYAASKEEMIPMYNRINALVSQVYPDYSDGLLMRAPIMRVTIGDYLYRVPGFLENVNLSIENNAIWEIEEGLQLPQRMDVSVSFKPIVENLPRRFRSKNVPVLIANGKGLDKKGIIKTDYITA